MKRYLIILFTLLSLSIYGNENFDKTINYQFNNAQAYVGETLYLLPLTNSFYGKNVSIYYRWFMDNTFDERVDCEQSMVYQYKYDPIDPRDCNINGTHKRWLEGHRFYVKKVAQYQETPNTYAFYLKDLNTGDNLKFIYHGKTILFDNCFYDFPFIVEKHLNYCKSLIGTNLVFGTCQYRIIIQENEAYYYNLYENDLNTGEKIQYDNVYAKWKIKDVVIDTYRTCICFIVTDGKHIAKVPYNFQYTSNHPKYNVGNRVFTENQWNTLVDKYGEEHMAMIMDTKVCDEMTAEEKYMAGGIRTFKYKNGKPVDDEMSKAIKRVLKAIF